MADRTRQAHEAPVANNFFNFITRILGGRVSFLGIVGDSAHAIRRSGHNYGAMREYACTNPEYAHAVDIHVDGPTSAARILQEGFKSRDVSYQIYRGVGYYPAHRGGGRFASSGHPDHVHTSFVCGSTFHNDWKEEQIPVAIGETILGVTREINQSLKELDRDLPEKDAYVRLKTKVDNLAVNVNEIEQLVRAIAAKVGV